MRKKLDSTCLLGRVLCTLLLVYTGVDGADPAVGLTMGSNTNYSTITISGYAIQPFKKATIDLEYPSSIDISTAYIGSPVSSISIGATIEKDDNILRVYVSTTKGLAIDSISFIEIVVPASGVNKQVSFTIRRASFIDPGGVTYSAAILNSVNIKKRYIRSMGQTNTGASGAFLINGRRVLPEIADMYSLRSRSGIPFRILKK